MPSGKHRTGFPREAADTTEHTRIVVVSTVDHTFGIVVDAVNEVLRIRDEQLEPPPAGLVGAEQAYIKGLVKMEEKIMILLSLEGMLTQDEKSRIAGSAGQSS